MIIGDFEDFKNSLTFFSFPLFMRTIKGASQGNLKMNLMKGIIYKNSLDQMLEDIEKSCYNYNISIYDNIILKSVELAQKALRANGNSVLMYKGHLYIYFTKYKTHDIPIAIHNNEVYTCGNVNSVFVKIKIPENLIIEDFIQEFCEIFSESGKFKYFYI